MGIPCPQCCPESSSSSDAPNCRLCSTATTLTIEDPDGHTGLLTIDGSDPNFPPNSWTGSIVHGPGLHETISVVLVCFQNEFNQIEYELQLGAILCAGPVDSIVTVNGCTPLDLTFTVDGSITCIPHGEYHVTQ